MNKSKKICDFGGDAEHCEDCAYFPDYKYDEKTGECRVNKWTEAQRSVFEGPLTNSEDR